MGDRVAVRPGQSIPVDGVIVEAAPPWTNPPSPASPSPWTKAPGTRWPPLPSTAPAYFVFEASRVGEDTTLAR